MGRCNLRKECRDSCSDLYCLYGDRGRSFEIESTNTRHLIWIRDYRGPCARFSTGRCLCKRGQDLKRHRAWKSGQRAAMSRGKLNVPADRSWILARAIWEESAGSARAACGRQFNTVDTPRGVAVMNRVRSWCRVPHSLLLPWKSVRGGVAESIRRATVGVTVLCTLVLIAGVFAPPARALAASAIHPTPASLETLTADQSAPSVAARTASAAGQQIRSAGALVCQHDGSRPCHCRHCNGAHSRCPNSLAHVAVLRIFQRPAITPWEPPQIIPGAPMKAAPPPVPPPI